MYYYIFVVMPGEQCGTEACTESVSEWVMGGGTHHKASTHTDAVLLIAQPVPLPAHRSKLNMHNPRYLNVLSKAAFHFITDHVTEQGPNATLLEPLVLHTHCKIRTLNLHG